MRKRWGATAEMKKRICKLAGCVLVLALGLVFAARAAERVAALFLDGVEVTGTVSISSGGHRISAQSDAGTPWIAVYVNGRMEAVSASSALDYDFPESGAEIACFSLDSHFRPLGPAVRVTQRTLSVPDGVYAGSAQCLSTYINYMVDVSVTVRDGLVTEIQDRTLKTPLSTNDKALYNAAWRSVSKQLAETKREASAFSPVDAVSGATISSTGIQAAIRNALEQQTAVPETAGEVYAPEGISLYARTYPVVTVRDGKLSDIRIVPAQGTDAARVEAFAADIVQRQSVQGLVWPEGMEDDAFSIANLTDQLLYGKGVLK